MKTIQALLLISCFFALNFAYGNNSINLDEYELAAGPITLSQIPDDLSGITFNGSTNTLFGIENGSETVYEIDLAGNVLRSISLVGFEDTEGLTWLYGDEFVVVEERRGRIVHITIGAGTTTVAYPTNYMQLPGTWFNNQGIEGVGYNPATNELTIVKEKTPRAIYTFVVPATFANPITVTSPFDLEINNFGFGDTPGLHHLGINTGLPCGANVSDKFLIISHESQALVETDNAGIEYSRLDLTTGGANGTLASTIPQPEGVTMDNNGNLYITSEPNLLYIFSNPNPCPAPLSVALQSVGNINCIGTDAPVTLTATAAGGTAPYTYQWQDVAGNIAGANTNTYTTTTAAAGDTYQVTITDATGCIVTSQIIIPAADESQATLSCPGPMSKCGVAIHDLLPCPANGTFSGTLLDNFPGSITNGIIDLSNIPSTATAGTYTIIYTVTLPSGTLTTECPLILLTLPE